VTDRHGASAEASIRISLVNDAPTASIESPDDGVTLHFEDSVKLKGEGRDKEEGKLSGGRLEWSARSESGGRSRSLGDGGSNKIKGKDLGFGTHRVTLVATDDYEAESDPVSIRVVVPNREPTVTISSPADRTTVVAGQVLVLSGEGLDPDRDRRSKNGELKWSAQRRDGTSVALGEGRELEVSDLAPGRYRIVLVAVDPDDETLTGRGSVFLTVGGSPTPVTGASSPETSGGTTGGAISSVGG
jgi:hypothetical protein